MSKEKNNKEEIINNDADNSGSEKSYKIINKEEKEGQIILEIEIPFSELENKREKSIEVLGREIEIKGFRKGSAPKNLIEQEVGETKIVEEMSYQAIINVLPNLVSDEKINALTQPQISITKLAPNNPMVFKASFVLMPEINIADYKKIAKSVEQAKTDKVSEDEINEYIDYIRGSRAEAESLKKKTSADPKEREEANKKNPENDAEQSSDLPEFNDEFVKTLGDFKNVDDFKKQLAENMQKEKEQKTKQKRRLEIIEKIISESKIEIPDLMIQEELQRMLQQFKGDLSQAKMEFNDYLKQINKSEEDLMKEWRPDAIKRTKMNLILPKIAVEEKINADPKMVEHEVKHLKQHHPDIDDEHAKSYVSHMLRNDEVFKFLEDIK